MSFFLSLLIYYRVICICFILSKPFYFGGQCALVPLLAEKYVKVLQASHLPLSCDAFFWGLRRLPWAIRKVAAVADKNKNWSALLLWETQTHQYWLAAFTLLWTFTALLLCCLGSCRRGWVILRRPSPLPDCGDWNPICSGSRDQLVRTKGTPKEPQVR